MLCVVRACSLTPPSSPPLSALSIPQLKGVVARTKREKEEEEEAGVLLVCGDDEEDEEEEEWRRERPAKRIEEGGRETAVEARRGKGGKGELRQML